MHEDRVVEVWAHRSDGGWSCGSGYLVSTQLVLTAAHVIVASPAGNERWQDTLHEIPSSNDVRIRTRHIADPIGGEVVWRGTGSGLDMALVEITDERWRQKTIEPVRWGRATCQQGRVECAATGFPEVLLLPDQRREREQLSGQFSPTTGEKSGQYHVQVDNAPVRHMDGSSSWSGMSGAALFSSNLLIGVVIIDPDGFNGQRLVAVRIGVAFTDPEFVQLLVRHTGSSGHHRAETPALESAELVNLFAERPVLGRPHSPAMLLTPQVAAVRWFHRREEQVKNLLRWLESPEPFEAQLIVGPGGHGKTRLARELERRARADGWITGMVRAQTVERLPPESLARLSSCEARLLLIVDYAETRPEVIRELLERANTTEAPAVRLLMLARSPGQWWERLWGASSRLQEAVELNAVTVLSPLPPHEDQRLESFQDALADLAQALPQVRLLSATGWTAQDWTAAADRIATPDLSHPGYGSIMKVQLAALVALLQEGPRPASSTNVEMTHEDVLLLHEKNYWWTSAAALGLAEDTLCNAVTVATLLGAADIEEAVAVLARVPGLRDQDENQLRKVSEWLHTLYPVSDQPTRGASADRPPGVSMSAGQEWGALEPDRLGEYLVAVRLRDRPQVLDGPLAAATDLQLHRAFHVLARAGVDHDSARTLMRAQVTGQLARIGPVVLAVIMETEEPAYLIEVMEEAIARAADDAQTLASLADWFPVQAPAVPVLAEQVTRLERTVYQRLLAGGHTAVRENLAGALRRYAECLFALGRTNEALKIQSEAVALYRELSAEQQEEGSGGHA